MSLDWIWKSALLLLVGMLLLRIAGRKSISQMSIAPTVIMISIGTTIVQPIANHHLSIAIGSSAVFILTLLLVDWMELKFDWFERLIGGGSVIIIEDGQLQMAALKKIRYSVDQVELHLRQLGIANISDVQTATMESNGQIGYVLNRRARPLTVGDLEDLLLNKQPAADPAALFEEIRAQGHSKPVDTSYQ